ncbi:DUF4145 domain-containing protein [Streptomyces sp. NPDC005708]
MVRRTLEGVCSEQGVSGANGRSKPLVKMLEQLKNEGKIDGRLLEWAQELRVLGNQGAHFTGTGVSREDAADGLALVEALLDYLHVLAAQFTVFKNDAPRPRGPVRTALRTRRPQCPRLREVRTISAICI